MTLLKMEQHPQYVHEVNLPISDTLHKHIAKLIEREDIIALADLRDGLLSTVEELGDTMAELEGKAQPPLESAGTKGVTSCYL